MAGRFVSIDDAARLLGVTVDEVKRFVERKKLFPLHDGNFKIEEIERVRATLGDDSSMSGSLSGSLSLDLDGGDLALDLGGPESGASAVADAGSQTIVRGEPQGGGAGGLSGLALGENDDDDDTVTDGGDLVLESNSGASSPSLGKPAASGSLVGSATSGDPQALDISAISLGSVAGLQGSQLTGPVNAPGSNAGSGFSMPADSGLSLEDGGLQISGIDLDTGGRSSTEVDAGDSLQGEEFNLGEGIADEDSASVVIATEESGDSSFFANVADDSASVALDSSSIADSQESMLPADVEMPAIDMRFSGWQIAGLTCCALILLTGGLLMYDLLGVIHKPQGEPNSGLLLNAFGNLMGWKR